MVDPHVRRRVYGAAAAVLVTAGLLLARIGAAPTAQGYRHAIAAGPGGTLYAAEQGRLLQVVPQGGVKPLGATGPASPLALAAEGGRLLLGTDSGVSVSVDGGASWRSAPVPPGRYPAVWLSGTTMVAGQWAGRIWRSGDAGASWASMGSPGGGEYQAFAESQGNLYAATLTGVLRSPDGMTWESTGLPSRVTALSASPGGLLAGDWRGDLYSLDLPGPPRRVQSTGAGVWALSGSLMATTDGIRGGPAVGLRGKEISALVSAGPVLYAGVARGPVLDSTDGGLTWRTVLEG